MPGYCVKCRTKRVMRNKAPVVFRNRKRVTHATTGLCPACGTRMYRIER